jgi:hypothetical protein
MRPENEAEKAGTEWPVWLKGETQAAKTAPMLTNWIPGFYFVIQFSPRTGALVLPLYKGGMQELNGKQENARRESGPRFQPVLPPQRSPHRSNALGQPDTGRFDGETLVSVRFPHGRSTPPDGPRLTHQ